MTLRLQARYSLAIVALIIALAAILAGIFMSRFRGSLYEILEVSSEQMSEDLLGQMRKRGEGITRILAENLVNPLYNYDMEQIRSLLVATGEQEDVLFVYVFDSNGRILHDGMEDIPLFGASIDEPEILDSILRKDRLLSRVKEDVLWVSMPIWIGDTPLGGVKVILSLQQIKTDIALAERSLEEIGREGWSQISMTLAGTTLILLILGVIVAVSLADRLIRPIEEVATFAGMIGRGHYYLPEPSARGDEIGNLINSFRQMSLDLRETTVSRNYVESILGSMTDALAVLDGNGRLRTVNHALCILLGLKKEELLERDFTVLFPEENRGFLERCLEEVRDKGRVTEVQTNVLTADGRTVAVALSGSAMRDEEGVLRGIVCLVQDITERLRVQKQLQTAKETAEAANRAKSEFLAKMSHEIRTPMNGILGMTELLLGTDLNPRQEYLAEMARSSGETLLAIINDILDFSKIEAGKVQIEEIDFDLVRLAEETAQMVAPRAHQKNLELAVLLEKGLPANFRGDPVRLRQVLTNLLDNAVKFTEKGEVVLRIRASQVTRQSAELQFSIRDTGIGISPRQRGLLFQPFSQADGSTTRRYGGTGLGLVISRELVEMMGGWMDFETKPGQGSEFRFILPLTRSEACLPEEEPGAGKELQGLRTLVVDDNASCRRSLQERLSSWGMKCDGAESGEEGLQRLEAAAKDGAPFDLILVDQKMPGLDGMETIRRVRRANPDGTPRVILLTCADLPQSALSLEIAACLSKPVRISELRKTLIQVLKNKGYARSYLSPGILAPPPAPKMHRAQVLLAEDNPVNQEVAMGMLQRLGCEVTLVANGREAVEASGRFSYDLIFMDCQMPEMDGYEATVEIRRREKKQGFDRHVPIVALTAHAMAGDREKCLFFGMDDYLAKPIREEQLSSILDRWLAALAPVGSLPQPTYRLSPPPESAGEDAGDRGDGEGPSADVIDPKALDHLRVMDPSMPGRVVRIFLEEAPKAMANLREAVTSGDVSGVRICAHNLKSSSGTLGARRMSALCKELEIGARQNSLELAGDLLEGIEDSFAETMKALQKDFPA